MVKRIYLKALRTSGFVLIVCLPIMLAIYFAHVRAMSDTQQHLHSFGKLVMEKTEIVISHVNEARSEAERFSGEICSPRHMANMLDIVRGKLFVADLIYVSGDKLLCSTSYKPLKPLPAPLPSYTRKPDVAIYYYLDTPFYAGHKMTYMQRGHYMAVINPLTWSEVLSEDDSLIYGVYDTVTRSFFSLSPGADSDLLHHFILRKEKAFTEDNRFYAVDQSAKRPIAVIVSTSETLFNRQWYHQLTLTLPLGVICSLLILIMWSRTRQQLNSPRRMLLRALTRKQLKLHYQPIIDIQNGYCVGAEALLRWVNFNGQTISPGTFIPLAESEGLIHKISDYVVDAVFKDFGEFLADHPGLYISINLSASDFHSSRLITVLSERIKTYNIRPGQIKIEVTERGFIDVEKTRPFIQEFRNAGFKVAIDDFGTGYSNLHNLQYLNVDILKIDKSFIDSLASERASHLLVEHIIEIAHSLNLTTIAEGVETEAQVAWLVDHGVEYCQGWYFAKALPPQEFIAWLYTPGGIPVRKASVARDPLL
ncbi:EAL domain-containing protein [Cedecea neteri]|uniref:cyclic-guanylate-specific phosphodiesterase n=1 Tax=Cedecea neteri TaxID=158822 RepID=A0AAN0VT06_9ENTR|nr:MULTISPECIES: EAL domain-containing protein [Cedecea]AIR60371.1 signal peptide protein [Cedecea neteri]WNJ79301.1 EAL domain-containing protein [Cedecea neteri]SMG45281.1 sensor c-di-GMP phosphodiesterase, contains CSS-motif sensor and EAL domain [Cedecea sp. NFIX57]